MKKQLIIFCCLMAISALLIYPILMKGNSNTEISSISEKASLNKTGSATTAAEEPKKVLMHYMGWFGPDSLGRHWDYGLPRKPIIGFYNSQSWATQMYHILLSWSCGIDGLIINVKTDYDLKSLKMLTPTLKRIRDIDSTNFNYKFAVSYDDQGMDNLDSAKAKFTFLKESILPNNPNYLKYNDTPVIFIYNYKPDTIKKTPEYLTASQYKNAIDFVFSKNQPKVIWNEIEAPEIANSYYPWVKADSESNGTNWGKDYLDWFYKTIDSTQGIDFATGGVWAGFDERSCKWDYKTPLYRWSNRMEGTVYDTTWSYIKSYPKLNNPLFKPLKWVYIETWNDWNEGSEIEPSTAFGYKYLLSTIKNINAFKGTTISDNTCKFLSALKIFEAANIIEQNSCDSTKYYPCLKGAIKKFILNNCDSAIFYANRIIDNNCVGESIFNLKSSKIEIYPNPAKDNLYIRQMNNEPYTIQLTDIQGKLILNKQGNKQLETIDISHFPKGIYLVRVKQKNSVFDKKIVVP